jgi:hypothetical protein
MTESALPRPARVPWLIPAVIFVVTLAALGGVILLAREAGKSDVPPQPAAFQPPSPLGYKAYDVERSDGGKLRLTRGSGQQAVSIDLQLDASTHIGLLQPVTPADLKPPLMVNVIAIPNEVRNYAIRLLAFAPVPERFDFDGPFIPLADGFAGYEPSRDASERSVVSAILESFDGRNGVTRTSTGPGTIYIDPTAPVRMLKPGAPNDIKPGDRVAVHTDARDNPDPARGVLVLMAGAE